jgi:putative colanic acid biosynthesis UDP-glucose lipid carrier transferase
MLAHTEQYSHLISQYMVRHFVKPGVTGWAQVTGFRGETRELWQMGLSHYFLGENVL